MYKVDLTKYTVKKRSRKYRIIQSVLILASIIAGIYLLIFTGDNNISDQNRCKSTSGYLWKNVTLHNKSDDSYNLDACVDNRNNERIIFDGGYSWKRIKEDDSNNLFVKECLKEEDNKVYYNVFEDKARKEHVENTMYDHIYVCSLDGIVKDFTVNSTMNKTLDKN